DTAEDLRRAWPWGDSALSRPAQHQGGGNRGGEEGHRDGGAGGSYAGGRNIGRAGPDSTMDEYNDDREPEVNDLPTEDDREPEVNDLPTEIKLKLATTV